MFHSSCHSNAAIRAFFIVLFFWFLDALIKTQTIMEIRVDFIEVTPHHSNTSCCHVQMMVIREVLLKVLHSFLLSWTCYWSYPHHQTTMQVLTHPSLCPPLCMSLSAWFLCLCSSVSMWARIWYLGCHSVLHSFIPCVCHMHYWPTSLCDNSIHMRLQWHVHDSLIANLMYSLLRLHSNRKTKNIVFIKAAYRQYLFL